MTYLENIISHTVSDYIILLLINSKFKEEAATRPVTNLVELLIVYISSISAGFSILINSYRFCNNNVPVNLSYGDGDLILVNLFNICAKTQYRCQRLPAFKYQKEQIIPNEFFYGISGFNTGMDENLAIIINRANQSEKYPPSPSTVYKNMINYLSSAICENAITSEVVIMMMLRLFKEDTQRTLSLKDKFDSIDEMHPFRDLMQGIVKQMAHRDTNFFSLFHLENKDKNFLYVISNNFIKDTEKCAELQEKIEPFLEAIVFITILQNIVMSFEFNGAFNAKYRDVFLFVTDDQKNTIGNMDFIHSSGSRFPNNNTTIFEAVTEDIRTAVALLESVVSQNINEPNPHIEHVSGIESEFKPLDMKNIRKSSQDLNRYFQSLLT
jgi:hypothetical protein